MKIMRCKKPVNSVGLVKKARCFGRRDEGVYISVIRNLKEGKKAEGH